MLYRPRKQTFFVLASLLVFVLLSGCSLDTTGNGNATPTVKAVPQGTPLGVSVPVCHLSSCTNPTPVAGVRPIPDTWSNVHSFLTFDFNVTSPAVTAKNYDFVWGALPRNVYGYRLGNPGIMLSYYMTIHRDDGTFLDSNSDVIAQRQVPYWKAIHPDWILYKCDRTTPALENHDPNIPFDLTNTAMFNWQMQTYVQPASATYGYDALAVDNVSMENQFGACGHYDVNGNWVQQYTGQNVDPQWEKDVVAWLVKMQAALHTLPHPMLLIANFGYGAVPFNDPNTQAALAHVDGVLDESSFTHYGEYHLPTDQWVQMEQYVQNMQQENKPFFLINEFKNLNNVSQDDRQWVVASYLMCKQRMAYIYMSQIQGYGSDTTYSEYSAKIGTPTDDMYQAQNVYWRDYTNGIVVANPSSNPLTVNLPGGTSSASYADLYGQKVSQSFTLSGNSAKVLLKQ